VFLQKGEAAVGYNPVEFYKPAVYDIIRHVLFIHPNMMFHNLKTKNLTSEPHLLEPNIETDIEGNATISFFNADNRAILKADVEGIAEPGVPMVERRVLK